MNNSYLSLMLNQPPSLRTLLIILLPVLPSDWSSQQKKRFFLIVKHFYWEDSVLYKHCANQLIKICVPKDEMQAILHHCNSLECEGHYGGSKTTAKVLQ